MQKEEEEVVVMMMIIKMGWTLSSHGNNSGRYLLRHTRKHIMC